MILQCLSEPEIALAWSEKFNDQFNPKLDKVEVEGTIQRLGGVHVSL